MMIDSALLAAILVGGTSLLVMVVLLLQSRKGKVDRRVAELSEEEQGPRFNAAGFGGGGGFNASPYAGVATLETAVDRTMARKLQQHEKKQDLQERLIQAGVYSPNAARAFSVLRLTLLCVPAILGLMVSNVAGLRPAHGLLIGLIAGLTGTLAPTFWLDHVKKSRQTQVRRALPDALDIICVCLQGGLSLSGALTKVAGELAVAHRLLAMELNIVQRHIQMGRSTAEAIKEMAGRLDLEELRSLASAINQAERVGSSIASAMEVFADTLRLKRHQRAEEMAHEASVKMLFPTLLFIFPAIFVVILGPAAIQIYQQLIQGMMRSAGV